MVGVRLAFLSVLLFGLGQSAILEMIRAVQSDTAAHAEASEAVAASVARLLENAQHSGESLPELQQLLGDLHRNATETIAELAHFQAGTR